MNQTEKVMMNQIKTIIYSERIEQARRIAGFTQKQLAEKIGVNQSEIAHYEKGRAVPPDGVLAQIAETTGFTPKFFTLAPLCEFPKGSLSYRAAKSVTVGESDRAYINSKLLFEQYSVLAGSFQLREVQIPRLKEKPEKAAEMTRISLELSPDLPIKNLNNSLERNGTIILPMPIFLNKIDAFSTWVELQGKRPLIAQVFGKSGDRIRFSLAHELGHLVMHHPPKANIMQMEKEANNFASFFLLPECIAKGEFVLPVTLQSLGELKVKWGISLQALIYIARNYEIITSRQASYLFSQIKANNWWKQEPLSDKIKLERPQLFRKMVDGLYKSPEQFADDMCISDKRANEIALFA